MTKPKSKKPKRQWKMWAVVDVKFRVILTMHYWRLEALQSQKQVPFKAVVKKVLVTEL